jgi:hypothetical protein
MQFACGRGHSDARSLGDQPEQFHMRAAERREPELAPDPPPGGAVDSTEQRREFAGERFGSGVGPGRHTFKIAPRGR